MAYQTQKILELDQENQEPIGSLRGAILVNDSGERFFQLKLKNNLAHRIEGAKVQIVCYDEDGMYIGSQSYVYQSVGAKPGEIFGTNRAIPIEFEGTDSFSVIGEELEESEPEIEEAEHPVRLADPKGEIVFDHVDFRYEKTGPDVLKDVSFRIESGQSAAFAGVSGIGKTTISLLLARFYDVTGGRICIDGTDIRQLSLDSLRGAIGLVQQEVYIFNGTIRDNIRYGKRDASQEEIEDAARKADIHDFIMSLEKGYDTEVGTRGIRLSGGQRQRVSIARLFLKDPKILILDEATSALDYESERAVQESLERLMQGRTSIVIAHRLSTIRGADQIYVMGKQNIVEQGTHEELLARGGEYARLCRLGLSGPQ